MDNLVQIPAVARTVLYYVLALGNAVLLPLSIDGTVDPVLAIIIANVSAVFGFTLAAQNVPQEKKVPNLNR